MRFKIKGWMAIKTCICMYGEGDKYSSSHRYHSFFNPPLYIFRYRIDTVRIPQTSSDCSGKSSSLVFVLYNEKCDVVSLLLHCPQMLFYLREDQSPGSSILSLSLSLGGMIGEKYIDWCKSSLENCVELMIVDLSLRTRERSGKKEDLEKIRGKGWNWTRNFWTSFLFLPRIRTECSLFSPPLSHSKTTLLGTTISIDGPKNLWETNGEYVKTPLEA